jgi:hypothetical protein
LVDQIGLKIQGPAEGKGWVRPAILPVAPVDRDALIEEFV